jgi:hypothetical protein
LNWPRRRSRAAYVSPRATPEPQDLPLALRGHTDGQEHGRSPHSLLPAHLHMQSIADQKRALSKLALRPSLRGLLIEPLCQL